MSSGTLYTIPTQAKGKIIRAIATLAGVKYELPKGYVHFESNKTPQYLEKFPHGKIPAWEGKDGFKLFEAVAIARYFASLAPNAGLFGNSKEEAALVDQWIHLVESELDEWTSAIWQLVNSKLVYSKPNHNTYLERQLRALGTLEKHLSTRTFLVGERLTLADVYVAGLLTRAVAISIDAPIREKHPNVIRHLETIVNQPKIKDIFGPTQYIEKGLAFAPPKKEKEEKKKEEKKPAAPKQEKKPKKEEKNDEEEDEPSVPPEPKVKNPLDDLPKSSFNLEDWKRAYSNKDTRGPDGSLEWFYQNFDKEGFSIWRVDFRYNNELTQTFMSNNQIVGFFNRLEASRKYLFGSVGVLGVTNDSVISGVFILRGKSFEPVVNVAPDWESYEYKAIDLADAQQKAFFEGALAWDLEIDGKKWADGKNFK